MDYWTYNFADASQCLAWLKKKDPHLQTNIVGLVGTTSSGKSAAINNILGAYVRKSAPQDVDRGMTLVRCVRGDEFGKFGGEDPKVMNPDVVKPEAWHRPKYLGTDDPRYGKLYVHSSFTPVVKEAFRAWFGGKSLEEAECVLVNYDVLVDNDPSSRAQEVEYATQQPEPVVLPPPAVDATVFRNMQSSGKPRRQILLPGPQPVWSDNHRPADPRLLETIFVDSRGVSEAGEGAKQTFTEVLQHATKSFCFLPPHGQQKGLMDDFTDALMTSKGFTLSNGSGAADGAASSSSQSLLSGLLSASSSPSAAKMVFQSSSQLLVGNTFGAGATATGWLADAIGKHYTQQKESQTTATAADTVRIPVSIGDFWKSTDFVMTNLDRFIIAEGGIQGLKSAAGAAKAMTSQVNPALFPVPDPLTVGIPTEVIGINSLRSGAERQLYDEANDWPRLRSKMLLEPRSNVCDLAALFFAKSVLKTSPYDRFTPRFVANSDAWYATEIEKQQKCPLYGLHRDFLETNKVHQHQH